MAVVDCGRCSFASYRYDATARRMLFTTSYHVNTPASVAMNLVAASAGTISAKNTASAAMIVSGMIVETLCQ